MIERNISALCQSIIFSSYNCKLVQARKQISKKLSRKVSELNNLLRSSFAAVHQLQTVVVNLPKIKLPNAYFSQILTLQNYVVVEQLFSGAPKGKRAIVAMLQPLPQPPFLRTTSNPPKILSKNIPKHWINSLTHQAIFAVFSLYDFQCCYSKNKC